MSLNHRSLTILVLAIFSLTATGLAGLSYAQDPAPAGDQSMPPQPEPIAAPVSQPAGPVMENGEVTPDALGSLLFTYWEHKAIEDARNAIGQVKAPTEAELLQPDQPKPKPPPEERYVRLGGIVYRSAKDWTIWLNEERVTPDAVPPEVMDLRVYKGYIEVKWLDDYTNQILPIRLRPHQRFNIDTRLFLPG